MFDELLVPLAAAAVAAAVVNVVGRMALGSSPASSGEYLMGDRETVVGGVPGGDRETYVVGGPLRGDGEWEELMGIAIAVEVEIYLYIYTDII